jgi:ABC-type multidrug transport system fused ATPase/permease subunit
MTSSDDNLTIWDGEWWTTEKHIYLYSVMIGALLLLIVSRSFAFYRMCLRVAVNLHDRLFRGVTRATMWFFNQNSTGRIINRFSKDIGTIDSMLPVVIVDCIQVSLNFNII